MIKIKAAFKGKNVLLGAGIDSLEKVEKEMQLRFPDDLPFGTVAKYQGKVLSSFAEVEAIVESTNIKTIKLDIEPAEKKEVIEQKQEAVKLDSDSESVKTPRTLSKKSRQEKKQRSASVSSSRLSSNSVKKKQVRKSVQIKQKKKVYEKLTSSFSESSEEVNNNEKEKKEEIPYFYNLFNNQTKQKTETKQKAEKSEEEDDLYRCFYCEGKLACMVCKNTGRLNENSKFVKLIDQIVDKRVQSRLKAIEKTLESIQAKQQENKVIAEKADLVLHKPIPDGFDDLFGKQKVEEVPKQKLSELSTVSFYVENHPLNPKKVIVGEEFDWTWTLNTKDAIDQKIEVNIIDEKTGATMPIKFKNQSKIRVGPFYGMSEGKLDKIFRLFYFKESSEMQYFGPRFGFSIDVVKTTDKKQLSNSFRQKIDACKKKLRVIKNTEYIIQKMKLMGINQENYMEVQQYLIEDVIQTL